MKEQESQACAGLPETNLIVFPVKAIIFTGFKVFAATCLGGQYIYPSYNNTLNLT